MRGSAQMAWSLALTLAVATAACSQYAEPVASPFAGSYRGATETEAPVVMDVVQDSGFALGHGRWAGEPFAFAVLGPWGGPTLMRRVGEAADRIGFERAPWGVDVRLPSGETVALAQDGTPPRDCSGAYSGRFATGGPVPLEMSLWQWGEVIAGHGRFGGQPAALAGWAGSGAPARLTMLLSDLSQFDLVVDAQPYSDSLRVSGLGLDLVVHLHRGACR